MKYFAFTNQSGSNTPFSMKLLLFLLMLFHLLGACSDYSGSDKRLEKKRSKQREQKAQVICPWDSLDKLNALELISSKRKGRNGVYHKAGGVLIVEGIVVDEAGLENINIVYFKNSTVMMDYVDNTWVSLYANDTLYRVTDTNCSDVFKKRIDNVSLGFIEENKNWCDSIIKIVEN